MRTGVFLMIVLIATTPAAGVDPGDIVVNIKAGAAFGTGCHPTTRLALTGLEKVCKNNLIPIGTENCRVLDIGTGSGVLSIAALKMGLDQGIGLDIDPCARAEAAENAVLNGLSKRLEISGSWNHRSMSTARVGGSDAQLTVTRGRFLRALN